MKMRSRFIIAFCCLPVLLLGCGPDAKRDNPLDPVNGSGVSGTVSGWGGGAIGNAVVTAIPANVSVRTNSSGQYNIELEGGRTYFLTVAHSYYHSQVDTINVPSDGRLKHNFVLNSIPRIDDAKVLTCAVHACDGQLSVYIMPQCIVRHPDGEEILERYYNLSCSINGKKYIPDSSRGLDLESRKYYWSFLDPLVSAGDTLAVAIDSAGTEIQSYVTIVPKELKWPTIVKPSNNSVFSPPDTMSWFNNNEFVTVSIEIWKDTLAVWRRNLSNVEKLYCDAALEGGRDYVWKIINTDVSGNRAIAAAIFYNP